MLSETQCECFQLRSDFTGSLWCVLMMLLCTRLWDKCLFLDFTRKTFAGVTRIWIGKQKRGEFFDEEQGKDNSFV